MKYCEKCQKKYEDSFSFCPKCGSKLIAPPKPIDKESIEYKISQLEKELDEFQIGIANYIDVHYKNTNVAKISPQDCSFIFFNVDPLAQKLSYSSFAYEHIYELYRYRNHEPASEYFYRANARFFASPYPFEKNAYYNQLLEYYKRLKAFKEQIELKVPFVTLKKNLTDLYNDANKYLTKFKTEKSPRKARPSSFNDRELTVADIDAYLLPYMNAQLVGGEYVRCEKKSWSDFEYIFTTFKVSKSAKYLLDSFKTSPSNKEQAIVDYLTTYKSISEVRNFIKLAYYFKMEMDAINLKGKEREEAFEFGKLNICDVNFSFAFNKGKINIDIPNEKVKEEIINVNDKYYIDSACGIRILRKR